MSHATFFFSLHVNDQFHLLQYNATLVLHLQMAWFLSLNFADQMTCLFGQEIFQQEIFQIDVDCLDCLETPLEFSDLFLSPWASEVQYEEEYGTLMQEIRNVPMDQESMVLTILMALTMKSHQVTYEDPKAISSLHDRYSSLLEHQWLQKNGRKESAKMFNHVFDILRKMDSIFNMKRIKPVKGIDLWENIQFNAEQPQSTISVGKSYVCVYF